MMGLVCGSAEGVGFGDAPLRPEHSRGTPEPRRPASRRRVLVGLAVAFGFGPAAGCGGAQREATTPALPPADPAAVREFVEGTRLMQRAEAPGARGRRAARQARDAFQRALTIDANLWEAHYNLGVLQRRRGYVEDALASFEAALAIQPASDDALRAAAEASWALGDERGASDRLERLVRRSPDDVGARVSLAVILRAQERWDEALEQAREVLVRAPESATALLVVARIYRARDAYDVAKLVLQKALALVPDDEATLRAEVYDEQGLLELARGDTQAAFEAFGQAIAADASFSPARMNMGSVLLHAGDFAGARAQYEAVLEADAENLEAKVALAIARRGEGDHRVARRLYREVLRADPDHPDALLDYAILRADFLDEREASVETFEAFLAAAPRRHPGREVAERYLAEIRAFAEAPEAPEDEGWVEEGGDPAEEEWVDEGDESWDDGGGDEEWEDLE